MVTIHQRLTCFRRVSLDRHPFVRGDGHLVIRPVRALVSSGHREALTGRVHGARGEGPGVVGGVTAVLRRDGVGKDGPVVAGVGLHAVAGVRLLPSAHVHVVSAGLLGKYMMMSLYKVEHPRVPVLTPHALAVHILFM